MNSSAIYDKSSRPDVSGVQEPLSSKCLPLNSFAKWLRSACAFCIILPYCLSTVLEKYMAQSLHIG